MPRVVKRFNPNIIRVKRDFASLRKFSYSSGGTEWYRYEINVDIDQITAMKNDVIYADISIYLERPPREPSLLMQSAGRDNSTKVRSMLKGSQRVGQSASKKVRRPRKNKPQQLIRNLQMRSSFRKDMRRKRKRSSVYRTKLDFTAYYDNELAKKIKDLNRVRAMLLMRARRRVVLMSLRDIKRSNQRVPLLKVQKKGYRAPTKRTSRAASVSLVMNAGIDPASVYRKRKRIQSTQKAIGGITMRAHPRIKASSAAIKPLLVGGEFQRNSVIRNPRFSEDSLIPVVRILPVPDVNARKRFWISSKRLKGKSRFYIKIDVRNNRKKILYSTVRRVDHARQMAALNTPRRSPRILFSPYRRHGRNVLEVRQRDPVATHMALYRKKIDRAVENLKYARYERIGLLKISKSDNVKKFIDRIDNSKTYIYRAVPIGPTGEIGIKFRSAVARGIPIKNAKVARRINNLSLTTTIGRTGIDVRVSDMPVEPVAVKVLRRDMTLREQAYVIINDPDPVRLIGDPDGIIEFVSTDTKEDHIYEFAAVLIYEDGDEDYATSNSLIEYNAIKVDVVESKASAVTLETGSGGAYDITFNIKTRIVPGEEDIIKSALEEQDLLGQYSDLVTANREELEQLVTHTILRTDLTTGHLSNLGLFVAGAFSDSHAAQLVGAPPLSRGHSYRYTIIPQLRSPETLYQNYETTKTDPLTGKQYTFRPSKFKSPMVLSTGTLPGRGRSSRITAKNAFEQGAVGSPIYLKVDVPPAKPTVTTLKASKLDRDTVEIRWKVSGDADLIDFFIVQAVKMDGVEFIGVAHNDPNINSFKFYDELDDHDQQIYYRVRMVYCNYSASRTFNSNRVVV